MAISRTTKIGFLLTFMILFVSGTFYIYQLFFASNYLVGEKQSRYLYIPQGADFKQVKDSLEKNRLVHDFLPFAFVSRLTGYRDHVKPGAYLIEPNEPNFSLIRRLKAGSQTPVKLTFNSIRTKIQLAERMDAKLELSANDLLQELDGNDVKEKYNLDTYNSISLFIPDTYEVYWTIKPKALIEKMGKAYSRFWNTERLAKAEKLKLSPAQIMTIASITQAETNKVDEMPRVAGVYLN